MKQQSGEKKIGSILNTLMRSERFAKDTPSRETLRGTILTTLGSPLIEQEDGRFLIDVTGVRFITGIPGFVNYLAKQTLEKCHKSTTDVLTQVAVDAENTPELAALGVAHVVVYARNAVARSIVETQEHFVHQLRLVFNALQTPQWGKLLFPGGFGTDRHDAGHSPAEQRPALHFPLLDEAGRPNSYFFLVEYDGDGRFLRITIEDAAQSRLFLKRIPHRVVKEAGTHHYQQDISTIVEQIFTGIHRECQNQQTEYTEIPGRQYALFELLVSSGLPAVTSAVFRWAKETSEMLLLRNNAAFSALLAKVLLLLEDKSVLQALSDGNMVEMLDNNNRIYFDMSRKGARLNVSLGEQRKLPDMLSHLKRMPTLFQTAKQADPTLLSNYRVLLIHHATSEVLGFVKALEQANCPAVTTLFIRYRGVVPDALLDDMLSMPEDAFRWWGLQRIELRDAIDSAYILSRQYSSINSLNALDAALRERKGDYLDSMRFTSLHLFFREAFQAMRENRRLVLIEDGGYTAPALNRYCHTGKTLGQMLEYFDVAPPDDLQLEKELEAPLYEWLQRIVPAFFEHTANGYYQLRDVEKEVGGLRIPVFTIALSKYKNVVEAESCAYSLLNAVQSIFYGLGKCIMYRHSLVLGSKGNIGRFLRSAIEAQTTYGKVYGLDLKVDASSDCKREFACIEDMPDGMWRRLDLFIGMTGISVLKQPFFEKLLVEGTARELFFASGSTKTVEFEDLTNWLGQLARANTPRIAGQSVRLETTAIIDPQGNLLQGHRVRVYFSTPSKISGLSGEHAHKDLYMLGDSMPINFLYYGVPGEVIDGVFEELFSLVCGVSAALARQESFPPEIFAVDVNITKHAQRKTL